MPSWEYFHKLFLKFIFQNLFLLEQVFFVDFSNLLTQQQLKWRRVNVEKNQKAFFLEWCSERYKFMSWL